MAYEFQKLADVEAVEEFPEEGASVLIEHEGGIKKCPADGIGGGGAHIYRFEVDVETMSVSPTEQCDETTIAADLAAGITPFALIDQQQEYSEGGVDVLSTVQILIPFRTCNTSSYTGGDYDGYKEVSILFKSQNGSYSSTYIEGYAGGLAGEIEMEWDFHMDS